LREALALFTDYFLYSELTVIGKAFAKQVTARRPSVMLSLVIDIEKCPPQLEAKVWELVREYRALNEETESEFKPLIEGWLRLPHGTVLQKNFRDKDFTATIEDGKVRFSDGHIFSKLRDLQEHIKATENLNYVPSALWFWRIQQGDNEWVELRHLRDRA
jgi:hypothetical protein